MPAEEEVFIISDTHGEIPWYVPDNVLMSLSEAVKKWVTYPLEWIE
jgi:uroporphyrinogen decarboxylase